MNVKIPKANKDHSNFPCWIPTFDPDEKPLKPIIRCKCGTYTGIGLHHVHSDGRVTASYFHNNPPANSGKRHAGCGWHVFLTLEDYNMGEFKPVK